MSEALSQEWGVRVRTGCRVSFTLIDLNGETGRRNGMASMALRSPGLEAVVLPHHENAVEADENGSAHREAVGALLDRLREAWGGPPAKVVIRKGLPPHTGFGSGTTTAVAVGRAYAQFAGLSVGTAEIARAAGRAGTSGASPNLIERGGFLVDGGHLNPGDFAEDPKRYLVPTRFAGGGKRPPVLISAPFPTWPVLVIIPDGHQMHGETERQFFARTLPIPAEEARRTAHAVLMNLATSVLEADYPSFCRAVNFLTYESHFKQKQIDMQSSQVKYLLEEARRGQEIDAVAMSSEGPMCYAFTRRPRAAVRWLSELRDSGIVRAFWFSGARNVPADVDWIPVLDDDGRTTVA
ncbi:beta-ribofuranosylaminobenzene 5'-phosphate synthase family protein [Streptomyces sp. NPDC038707]|uniref:beta-ribofuranosylaminobenzene 5'-phosphate synthase family protein n=1 Tax=Streptomyces sp. NPDC038707 TaxID=3154329 RepID=UPI0033F1DB1C